MIHFVGRERDLLLGKRIRKDSDGSMTWGLWEEREVFEQASR